MTELSDCHGSPVTVDVADEGTACYMCGTCGRPCGGAASAPAPAAGSRPLAAGAGQAGGAERSSAPPAAIVHPVLSEQPGSRVTSGAARFLARHMPENGGSDSLDYKLRKMLADDFPRLLWQHNSDSRRAHRGWPDWVIGRRAAPGEPGAVIFRELKRESEKPSAAQQDWLDALTAAGFDAGVWRPGDYFAGRIALELAALAGFRIAAARGER